MATSTAAKKGGKKKNKSRAIVNYYRSHPNAKPREISERLNKRGMNITPSYVSTVLFNFRKKGGSAPSAETSGRTASMAASKTRRGRPARRRVGGSNGSSDVSGRDIMLVKELVGRTGSIVAARKALDLYSDIVN
jgi:hypothetical protein